MIRNIKLISILVHSTILISWTFIHFDLLTLDPVLGRDDVYIFNNILMTENLLDYFKKMINGDYWDLQPVRDITLFFNKFLLQIFGHSYLHLLNLIIAYLVLLKLKTFLMLKKVDTYQILIIILFIALHPLYNVTFAWITNRKHLLSILFILCYLSEWEKKNVLNFKTTIFMILSILSQPITIFIPCFAIGLDTFLKKKITSQSILQILILSIVIVSNYFFYREISHFAARNLMVSGIWEFGWVINVARAFAQIFFPVSFAAEYDPGNPLGLLGLLLAVMAGALIYKYLKRDLRIFILTLMTFTTLFPILPYNLRDAYILGTLLLLSALSIIFVGAFLKGKNIFVLILLLPLLGLQSFKFVDMWESDEKLSFQSYSIEGGAFNMTNLGYMYRRTNPDFAYELSLDLRRKYPDGASYHLFLLVAESYYYTKTKSIEEKLNTYLRSDGQGIFHLFFKYKFLKDQNNQEEGLKTLLKLKHQLSINKEEVPVLNNMVCNYYKDDCREIF
jgi:hypothetical protein